MTGFQYLIAAIFGVSLAAGQILFKLASLQTDIDGKPIGIFKLLFTLPMLSALGLYGATVLLYVYLLQQVPLSRAYLFSLAASVMVPFLAVLIFKEPFSYRYLVGASFVFIGVVISTTA